VPCRIIPTAVRNMGADCPRARTHTHTHTHICTHAHRDLAHRGLAHLHCRHSRPVKRVEVARLPGDSAKRLRGPQEEAHLAEGAPRAHLLEAPGTTLPGNLCGLCGGEDARGFCREGEGRDYMLPWSARAMKLSPGKRGATIKATVKATSTLVEATGREIPRDTGATQYRRPPLRLRVLSATSSRISSLNARRLGYTRLELDAAGADEVQLLGTLRVPVVRQHGAGGDVLLPEE